MDEETRMVECVRCDYNGSVFIVPKDVFARVVLETETGGKKYVRYSEGARLYGMSERSFYKLAHDAGAVHKWNKIALVNIEIIDSYLELFAEVNH